jgi:predicted transcriptional regulator
MTSSVGRNAERAEQRFIELLDKNGLVRLLDVFLTYETIPQNQQGLATFTGFDQGTVSKRVNELVDLGIVTKVSDAQPQEYHLNMDHPAAIELVEVHTELQDHVAEIQDESEEYDPEAAGPYDGSPFVELFRYPTNAKLLVALLRNSDAQLRVAHIQREADVDYQTVKDNIGLLCEVGIVKRIEDTYTGDVKYILNDGHPAKSGFEQVIDALEANLEKEEEPAAPENKEEITTKDGSDRADGIRKKVIQLLEDKMDLTPEQLTSEDGDQSEDEMKEIYALQIQAGKVPNHSKESGSQAERQSSDQNTEWKDNLDFQDDGRSSSAVTDSETTNAMAA